jgi:hypothetical protein
MAAPRSLLDLAGQVFREHRRQDHLTLTELQQRWPTLVGPGLAEHTWPTRLQKETLWIAAPDSSWAYQLQFLKQEILGHLRANFPASLVTELRFKVGAVPPPAPGDPNAPQAASIEIPPVARRPGPPAAQGSVPVQPVPLTVPDPGTIPDPLPPPELLRAAETITDPVLRAAFLRTLAKQARLARKPE